MPERLLHYIWQNKFFMRYPQTTTNGERIEVIDVGKLNTDGGPDFFNAKLIIGGQQWAGNVEMHINSSDWKRHHHDKDRAYDSVILHVVIKNDCQTFRTNGEEIPQCVLQYPKGIEQKYIQWLMSGKQIACQDEINAVPDIYINDWKSSLLADRLQRKADYIKDILLSTNNDWEETFYIILAHYLGFHTNGIPFELLAKQTPLAYIRKHRDDLFQIEAILFGQAGMLSQNIQNADKYYTDLQREYKFMQAKFGLTPIDSSLWKRLRMRPDNFPTVRIAELAGLIYGHEHLFADILGHTNIKDIHESFSCKTSEYWDTHYQFNSDAPKHIKQLGTNAINILIINVVIPFLYAYGESHNVYSLQERAEQFLEELPAEKNSIITNWNTIGLQSHSAADSQALIHLHERYCSDHKCLHCRIATKILSLTK